MPSFGEKLKREREKRAVTLEQISVSTKIGTRMLQALEEDKFNQLPGGIFNKGFVRAYARCVGLDEEQTVAEYLEASGDAPPVVIEAAAEPERSSNASRAARSSQDLPWAMFAAVLLLVAVALSLWSYRKREHRIPPDSSNPAPAATQGTTPIRAPAMENAPSVSSANSPPAPEQTKSEAKSETKPEAKPSPVPKTAASSEPAHPPVPTTVPSVAGSGTFSVVVKAREDSWVSISVDGTILSTETLFAGDQRSVSGRNLIVIRAGNIGAVDFFFNGKKVGAQGDYGEAKTLTFGAAGLEPNGLAPPVTQ